MTQSSFGIQAIEVSMSIQGNPFVIYPTVLWDEQEVILVDTGLPGQVELIRAAFEKASVPFDKLTKIIITHQDRDHIGSLPELARLFGEQMQILAHEIAVPFLSGKVPLVKSKTHAEPVHVDVVLHDGDVLPYAGGIKVVFSPGHTPDHTSLYHIPSKTLIAGDALTAQDGVLQSFNPAFTPDQTTALQSITKFQALELDRVIAYHGGICTDDLQAHLETIVTAPQTEQTK
ncbi:glyoxylase-like metal-dependent hydrolase (beta-lactamase superfamily II) [Paenibacillus taihuensis]|uniref:Glyoxylase-like metal-dependent hydrolase (Beta-lactamase superfamily II) n=1 Tax=Paenibacillus taihuensis TaxID=1156355 RepID=A0A3D9RR48_9BACL|nr:MBL fold metallo-hydrolase [Paenibacillus taihuensis]REE80201.1 glyoxylase-like metal-dependent hydrolase (beta-lactamase superfamily II) [Paenibacillus taihuensis]